MKKNRWTAWNAAKVAVVLAAVGMLGQKGMPKPTSVKELEQDVTLTGILGAPLGTYLTVEGDYFGPEAKTKSGLYVDKIDGKALKEPVVITKVEDSSTGAGGFGGAILPNGLTASTRYRLRGFESAEFVGIPDDPEHPPTAEQLKLRQADDKPRLHLASKFFASGVEGLGPVKSENHGGNK